METHVYDPVAHLNQLFGSVEATAALPAVARHLQDTSSSLGAAVARQEARQAHAPDAALDRLQGAQADLASVFARIEDVRRRAVQTEADIARMTADIKRLDGTKRNLTVSMTALKRLQMLTTAYEQLRTLARHRQYRECAGLLQAVLQLARHFASYRSVDQIAVLSRGVNELQRELLEQVCDDFEVAFSKDDVAARRSTLAEACQVLDALGDAARARLVAWYTGTMLREYRHIFRNDEAGGLDNIGRRFAWFRRTMAVHDAEHAALFPASWRVAESLASSFCDGTRDDLQGVLERSMRRSGSGTGSGSGSDAVDVDLLLTCLQETLDFEQGLERRFSDRGRASMDTLASDTPTTLAGAISTAFEPYLSLWVDAQDRLFAQLIPRYRAQPLLADEDPTPASIAQSALDLFHVYKVTLAQCAQLSTGERLLDLARSMARHLDAYQQVLLHRIKEPVPDIVVVLNSADFWTTNATQLEQSIRKRIDPDLATKVDFAAQSDAFLAVASACVAALVRRADADADAAWREMRNTDWGRMDAVSDHSPYVAALVASVTASATAILAAIGKNHYARAFCDHLVESVANTFLVNIALCRPVSEVAAEQMLLDKYTLTKSLQGLLALHADDAHGPSAAALAGFAKRAATTMGRVDPLLKTLQVRAQPPEGLVQAYLLHIADRSDANFRKMLDIKGVRKQDQQYLVDIFAVHRDSQPVPGTRLVQSSPLLSNLLPGPAPVQAQPGPQRFDPASFGEKLLSAARDGVDRLGTATATPGTASPGVGLGLGIGAGNDGADAPQSINDNLKNIGNFFRGARFGKRDLTPTGER